MVAVFVLVDGGTAAARNWLRQLQLDLRHQQADQYESADEHCPIASVKTEYPMFGAYSHEQAAFTVFG